MLIRAPSWQPSVRLRTPLTRSLTDVLLLLIQCQSVYCRSLKSLRRSESKSATDVSWPVEL